MSEQVEPAAHREASRYRTGLSDIGWQLLAFTGAVLIASGLFAFVLAASVKLLPYDIHYLGMTVEELCAHYNCRVVHFMMHDRISFGGSIISIGALYIWMAARPLRRGHAWAWWAFLISGTLGFASFLTYLGYGYLDVSHGIATMLLLPFFIMGLIRTYRGLRSPRGPRALLLSDERVWPWKSPGGVGRLFMLFTAAGMILAGLTIMTVGMTQVFVAEDLEYIRATVDDLHLINTKLVPLVAHDRAGFGGGLCSCGLAILITAWCGLRPSACGLWRVLLLAGTVGFGTAIGIHPVVGYTSFSHLLPAYAGALTFIIAITLLYKPMCYGKEEERSEARG